MREARCSDNGVGSHGEAEEVVEGSGSTAVEGAAAHEQVMDRLVAVRSALAAMAEGEEEGEGEGASGGGFVTVRNMCPHPLEAEAALNEVCWARGEAAAAAAAAAWGGRFSYHASQRALFARMATRCHVETAETATATTSEEADPAKNVKEEAATEAHAAGAGSVSLLPIMPSSSPTLASPSQPPTPPSENVVGDGSPATAAAEQTDAVLHVSSSDTRGDVPPDDAGAEALGLTADDMDAAAALAELMLSGCDSGGEQRTPAPTGGSSTLGQLSSAWASNLTDLANVAAAAAAASTATTTAAGAATSTEGAAATVVGVAGCSSIVSCGNEAQSGALEAPAPRAHTGAAAREDDGVGGVDEIRVQHGRGEAGRVPPSSRRTYDRETMLALRAAHMGLPPACASFPGWGMLQEAGKQPVARQSRRGAGNRDHK